MTNLIILVDTREKDTRIQDELNMREISFIRTKLKFGDYSFNYKGKSYENQCVVERKGSINEIIGNFTTGSERFKREFLRAGNCKIYLMIEADPLDIDKHNYRSKIVPNKVKSFINTWCYKFGLELKFVKKNESTDYILSTFEKFIQEELK